VILFRVFVFRCAALFIQFFDRLFITFARFYGWGLEVLLARINLFTQLVGFKAALAVDESERTMSDTVRIKRMENPF
jgi:hypothetical protein